MVTNGTTKTVTEVIDEPKDELEELVSTRQIAPFVSHLIIVH